MRISKPFSDRLGSTRINHFGDWRSSSNDSEIVIKDFACLVPGFDHALPCDP